MRGAADELMGFSSQPLPLNLLQHEATTLDPDALSSRSQRMCPVSGGRSHPPLENRGLREQSLPGQAALQDLTSGPMWRSGKERSRGHQVSAPASRGALTGYELTGDRAVRPAEGRDPACL